jgi:hypothetical protein
MKPKKGLKILESMKKMTALKEEVDIRAVIEADTEAVGCQTGEYKK